MKLFENLSLKSHSLFITGIICFSIITLTTINADEKPKENRSILVQEGDLSVTTEEAMAMLNSMNKTQKIKVLTDQEQFKNLLLDQLIIKKKVEQAKKQNLNKDPVTQWKIQKSTNIILAETLVADYKKKIIVPEDIQLLAKEHYDTHPEEFIVKEKVKVAHILIQSKETDDVTSQQEKKALTEKILKEIKQGLKFSEAAKKYSEDPGSAKKGGTIEYFTHGRMVKPFEEAAFRLKNKEDISDIIKSRFGYHIIKLLDHQDQNTRPYKEVKQQLINKQQSKYTNGRVASYSNSFNANDNTTIYLPAVQKLIKEATNKFLPQ